MQQNKLSETVRCLIYLLGVPFFMLAHYIWSCAGDILIAQAMGAFRPLPPGPYGQWTKIGDITWTFSSLIGLVMSLTTPGFGIIVVPTLAGTLLLLLIVNLGMEVERPFGKCYWLAWSVLLLWVVKVPVPIPYSLFYWVAMRF